MNKVYLKNYNKNNNNPTIERCGVMPLTYCFTVSAHVTFIYCFLPFK